MTLFLTDTATSGLRVLLIIDKIHIISSSSGKGAVDDAAKSDEKFILLREETRQSRINSRAGEQIHLSSVKVTHKGVLRQGADPSRLLIALLLSTVFPTQSYNISWTMYSFSIIPHCARVVPILWLPL